MFPLSVTECLCLKDPNFSLSLTQYYCCVWLNCLLVSSYGFITNEFKFNEYHENWTAVEEVIPPLKLPQYGAGADPENSERGGRLCGELMKSSIEDF